VAGKPVAAEAESPEARRAMAVALLSVALPPLLPYALRVTARVLRRWRDLSACDRRRVTLAALVDLCVLVVALAWTLYLIA
jgi:hypothetical protein